MLQLAPARDGMNLSPCLLGDDSGDSEVGVRWQITSLTFCIQKNKESDQMNTQKVDLSKNIQIA